MLIGHIVDEGVALQQANVRFNRTHFHRTLELVDLNRSPNDGQSEFGGAPNFQIVNGEAQGSGAIVAQREAHCLEHVDQDAGLELRGRNSHMIETNVELGLLVKGNR